MIDRTLRKGHVKGGKLEIKSCVVSAPSVLRATEKKSDKRGIINGSHDRGMKIIKKEVVTRVNDKNLSDHNCRELECGGTEEDGGENHQYNNTA